MTEKKCRISGEKFVISDKKTDFYKNMGVDVPSICPDEQMRNLMAWRNELKLYKRTCSISGKAMISAYPADTVFPVYNNDIWWGDTWDALEYGRAFDFSKPFFAQFKELQNQVPREGTSVFQSENCDFNGHIRNSRNCYLNALVANCEDTYYSYWVVDNTDCSDCVMTNSSELCYEGVDLEHCYDCVALHESSNCNNCYFSVQLKGCTDCIGCSNLVKKSCYIFNKPVSREEFEKTKEQIFSSYKLFQDGKKFLKKIALEQPHRFANTLKSENVTGDHLFNSKDCENCFDGHRNQDCIDSVNLSDCKDVCTVYSAGWPACELLYNSAVSRGSTNLISCYYSFFNSDSAYCDSCSNCKDCFGCIGLKHKQYCILNKQYTKEEYEVLLPKIKEYMKQTGEWGKFFPISISPFAYNETVAQQYYPLTKELAEQRGYKWREEKVTTQYKGEVYVVPEKIEDVPDEIVTKVLKCERSGKFYRIQKAELKFYRKMNLPIPRLHPDERHKERIAVRNPRKLYKRKCADCGCEIQTTFAPDRPEKVLCEECYLKIVD